MRSISNTCQRGNLGNNHLRVKVKKPFQLINHCCTPNPIKSREKFTWIEVKRGGRSYAPAQTTMNYKILNIPCSLVLANTLGCHSSNWWNNGPLVWMGRWLWSWWMKWCWRDWQGSWITNQSLGVHDKVRRDGVVMALALQECAGWESTEHGINDGSEVRNITELGEFNDNESSLIRSC